MVLQSYVLFDEMIKRGIHADNAMLASLVYGLLCRRRIREAYKIVEGIEKVDICVYHALIKGLLKLRKASEATQVFREMISKGCEPIMHTYIMLLQGHLGKRGRKGPDPVVNFETIFVGGVVKLGKSLEATKYVERIMSGGVESDQENSHLKEDVLVTKEKLEVRKLQRACLRNPVKIEAASKYSTVDTLKQQYRFVPAKYKVFFFPLYFAGSWVNWALKAVY
ncbi:hypothetical protein IFM89_039001 [Coptis chinensis]|uniref:Pentatricopeptide repeat-containing protein n=1 Tax=Coptis chinensis TaxID=261450 RepID=A0A835III7_9MAGN|nr:hypothetical protein IFM89_039001 [Coptis chinensis]